MKYDSQGRELPDPTPVALPAGRRLPESLESMLARMVRGHVSQLAEREGLETFEEANDFEIESDDEPLTAYEQQDMKLEALADEKRRLDELEDAFDEEQKAAKVREEVEERRERKKRRRARKAREAAGSAVLSDGDGSDGGDD